MVVLGYGFPSLAREVSGDVSGDWTLLMSPVTATGDCHVPAGSTLRIRPGVRVLLGPGASLIVDGTLSAIGEDQFPIFILPADPAGAPWGSILVTATGTATLASCTLRGGGAGLPGAGTGMLRAQGPAAGPGQLFLSKCEVSGSASSGVYVNGGSFSATGCRFFGNGGAQPTDAAIHVVTGVVTLATGADANIITNGVFSVYNEDVVPVVASGQWWGAGSGPQSPDNVPGIGSSVSDDVVFDNWITIDPHPGLGDLNLDGSVSVADVAILLRVLGGMDRSTSITTSLGDGVPDHTLNILDAARLARVAAGLESL
jgi:hypothetical protein